MTTEFRCSYHWVFSWKLPVILNTVYYTTVLVAGVHPVSTVRNAHLLHVCQLNNSSDSKGDPPSDQQVRTAFVQGTLCMWKGHAACRELVGLEVPNPHACLLLMFFVHC